MTRPGLEPFVSGLPGGEATPVLDPRGAAALLAIRERAEQDMRALLPLTSRRFDGAEWLTADPQDVAAYRIAADTKWLIDTLLADRRLALSLAARLAKRVGGR